MRAVRTVESNFTFLGPSPDVADLPGRIEPEENRFFAIFEFTDEERTMIANGAQLQLGIWSLPMPPVSVSIVNVEQAEGVEEDGVPVKPDWRCVRCDNLYVNDRAIKLDFKCGHCGGDLRLPGSGRLVICPVDGCNRPCDTTRYVMCNTCWSDVPRELGDEVYRSWGRRVRAHHDDESVERHEAAKQRAIDHVNELRHPGQTRLAL